MRKQFVHALVLMLISGALLLPHPAVADDVQNVAINGVINSLKASQLISGGVIDATKEPYKSGKLEETDAVRLINNLQVDGSCVTTDSKGKSIDQCVTILHLLRWGAADHSSVMFQKWYVFDPVPLKFGFYFKSAQSRFEGSVIPGRTKFRLIYMHINYDLTKGNSESIKSDLTSKVVSLNYPVSYHVAITKQQSQFWKDVTSLLSILGALQTAAATAAADDVGYYASTEFTSLYQTSSIAVSVSSTSSGKTGGNSTPLATQTYTNEGPSWIGLSFAVPLTSYKNVTYSQTNGTLTESQINQQNIYAVFDLFLPPVEPAWTTVRWVPHPIFGMPIKKQPLRNTTAGLAMGWRWLEPFGSVVFNVQQRKTASGSLENHLVLKGAWGLNLSVSDIAKTIKSSSAAKTASMTATKAASSTQ